MLQNGGQLIICPGINDNGSGSAANLHLARLFATLGYTPTNKVRFAWWGAEEVGLVGSTFYVTNLSTSDPQGLKNILANLNFDMLASPNWYRGVYNGVSDPNTKGSGVIQNIFDTYYASRGLKTIPLAFDGRSDYGPFLQYNIPAGGLAAGAEGLKSLNQRSLFGGSYNIANDVCYHEFCDTYENIAQDIYLQLAQGAAYTLQTLADQKNLLSYLNPPLTTDTTLQSSHLPTTDTRSPYPPLHIENNNIMPSKQLYLEENLNHDFYKTSKGRAIHNLRWPVA